MRDLINLVEGRIDELFDSTGVTWESKTVAHFEVKGEKYVAEFIRDAGGSNFYHFLFVAEKGDIGNTGRIGSASTQAFGKALECIQTFINDYRPYGIEFIGKGETGRGALYVKMARVLEKHVAILGYDLEIRDTLELNAERTARIPGGKRFLLFRRPTIEEDYESHLNEISQIGDFDDNINRSRLDTMDYEKRAEGKVVGDLNGLPLSVQSDPNRDTYYFLRDNDGNLLGKATVRPTHYEGFHTVSHIWFDPSIRKQGYGYALYVFLLNHNYKLISDISQTQHSKGVWAKLARNNFVHLFNRNSDQGPVGQKVINIDQYYSTDITDWSNHRDLVAVKPS